MTVIIASEIPSAIRGMLKRWFVEPKPNVFVGTLNQRTRDKVIDYVTRNAKGMSLLIIYSDHNCQGFEVKRCGDPDRRDTDISGLSLIAEQSGCLDNQPF